MKDEEIPTIDISAYINSRESHGRSDVIDAFRSACGNDGFFQLVGHGVPLATQKEILKCAERLFSLPQGQKDSLSLKKFPSRRGYEGLGQQTLDNAALPDMKEGFYIGREDKEEDIGFLRGPNVWPDLPYDKFQGPVEEYYGHLVRLGRVLWELVAVSLGYPSDIIQNMAREPAVFLKPIYYPPHTSTDPRQFSAAPHRDFGGITILLQQPGKPGLEVYRGDSENPHWIPLPALENVFVVNLGDMVQKWTGGRCRSGLHRVINRGNGARYSVPCFWNGNLDATNPFAEPGTERETVAQYVRGKFDKSFALPAPDPKL